MALPFLNNSDPSAAAAALVPTLAESSPKYKEMVERFRSLSLELRNSELERSKLFSRINAAKYNAEEEEQRRSRIGKLLGMVGHNSLSKTTIEQDRERLTFLTQHVRDIEAALEILKSDIAAERWVVSQAICERLEPHHRALCGELCEAFLRLHEVNSRYQAFGDAMNNNDIAWSGMNPMFPHFISGAKNSHGRLAHYLREMVKFGYLAEGRIPKELRQ